MWTWQLPAAVLVFVTWFNSPPASLADASRREAVRRQFLPHAAQALSNDGLPPPRPVFAAPEEIPPASGGAAGADESSAATADKDKAGDTHDEKWWRDRITGARDAVDHDQMTVDALQSQINGLTADWINRDNPAQKAQLEAQRNRALSELDRMKKQLDADHKAVDAIIDEARRAGVPPGWLRGGGE
jgi:hypothetical protein